MFLFTRMGCCCALFFLLAYYIHVCCECMNDVVESFHNSCGSSITVNITSYESYSCAHLWPLLYDCWKWNRTLNLYPAGIWYNVSSFDQDVHPLLLNMNMLDRGISLICLTWNSSFFYRKCFRRERNVSRHCWRLRLLRMIFRYVYVNY